MSDSWAQTTTPTKPYSFVKIEIGSSRNTWGHKLSNNTDTLVEVLTDHQTQITARVKAAGDTMTGSLTYQGDGVGTIYHKGTKVFDGAESHRTHVFKDDFRLYTEDGTTEILRVTPLDIKHGDKTVLSTGNFKPEENYVHVNGGTFKGSIKVEGDVKALSVSLDDKYKLYQSGANSVIAFDDNDFEYYARDTNTKIWYYGGKPVMSLDANGNLYCVANITAFSDEKFKENVETVDPLAVFKMRGVSFDFLNDGGKRSSGVIAQELQEIAPELVRGTPDGHLSVNYLGLPAYLIEGLKVLKAENEELRADLAEIRKLLGK